EPDPLVQAQADLATAVELYTVGVGQLQAGDPAGQSTIEAANAQIGDICTSLGFATVEECLAQFGLTLPELPATPVTPAAAPETPLEQLPGADAEVTPQAVEVLPEAVPPAEAAPVLDSAKDVLALEAAPAPEGQPAEPAAEPPAVPATQEPPPPPPTSDVEAQADIIPVEVQPMSEVKGEQVAVEALPTVEVPQNVTIINNVTNVTNNVNVTNNTTNVTNNTTNVANTNFTNSGFIFQVGVNLVINNPGQEIDRLYDDTDEVYYENLRNGRVKETIVRPNGVQIVTVRNRYGEILRRSRIMPDGREYVLAYYNEDEYDDELVDWRDPGDDLPPLRLTIPVRDYILDADAADEDEVELFLAQPPVEQVRRIYSIEDVKRSARIRDSVRRLEVGGLTFDSGKATIARSQVGALSKVANAMLAMLENNPGEVFLIEGHTDAVGSDTSNLVLSDQRAATVARILTDFYDIPPENLVTQGYGERYLKVRTQEAERLNRRVTIKRITPLVTVASN
ncbi:OmpA family protein, partial [Devosia sp.]|uniref:OmpA family protein n=1 Tax=Devosia sp. TaxID=1871048 RepID=UPI002EF154C7